MEARSLGKALVREQLAGCVNILGRIESFYRWKGNVETGREVALIAKTTMARSKKLIARVRQLHSYECPCVVIVPIVGGNPEFLKWLAGNLKPET